MSDMDMASEEALIYSALYSQKIIPEMLDIVKPDDFRSPANRLVFDTILDCWDKGIELNSTTLGIELRKRGHLDAIGGPTGLLKYVSGKQSAEAMWEYHAKSVHENGVRWRIKLACTRARQLADESDVPSDEIISELDEALSEIQGVESHSIRRIDGMLDDTLEALKSPAAAPTIATGFRELDELTNGGLRPGQMIVVAARPGVGKTTLGADIVREACIRNGKTALFFSLEMSADEINTRIIAAETETRFSDMRSNSLSPAQWDDVSRKVDEFRDANIYIDDTAGLTMADIRAKTKMMAARGLDLVVIDYLQLLTSGGRVESRQQEVSGFSQSIKRLAKECGIPIIAVAQLNREVERRGEGAMPKLSDLRESGSLEQDADIVILINRPDYQNPDDARAGEVDLVVAKHRGGQIKTITIPHQLHYSKFSDYPRSTFEGFGEYEGV